MHWIWIAPFLSLIQTKSLTGILQNFWKSLPKIPDVSIVVFGYMDENQVAIENRESFLNTINVNFTGAASILNVISRTYKEMRFGQIAGVSSVAGQRGRASNYIYGSAKAAFTTYLSGLRNELYPFGVQVLTILPGFVYTKMTEELKLPSAITVTPEYVARVIYKSLVQRRDIVYVKWIWKWIMIIIKNIPEFLFKKLTL